MPALRTSLPRRLPLPAALPLLLGAVGCGSLLGIEELKDETTGLAGAAGSATAGSGTAGSETAGSGTAGTGTAGTGTAGSTTAGAAGSEVAGSGGNGGDAGAAGSATCNEGETSCFDSTSQKTCQMGMLKVTPCQSTNPCSKSTCEATTAKCMDAGPVTDGQPCNGGTCKGGVCSSTMTCSCPNGNGWTGMPCGYAPGTTASNGATNAINLSMGGLVGLSASFSTEILLPMPFAAKGMMLVWVGMPGSMCTFTVQSGATQLGTVSGTAQGSPGTTNLMFQGTPMPLGQYVLGASCTGNAQLDEAALIPACAP